MNNSNYQSVPVLASVIGSKTRKAMYLVNITSMDGEKVYKDKWVPVQWGQGVTIDWNTTVHQNLWSSHSRTSRRL